MITIDGSYGEGGGQILRTSMGLAAIAGRPLTIQNVRAGRSKPGLQRQHLCAVQSVAQICSGTLVGDALKSTELQFQPAQITGGSYELDIGTAGSTTLVAQSILIPLLRGKATSNICISGGTHNPLAPPYDFFERVYLPHLRNMGVAITSHLTRHGLFPKGGGAIELQVAPPSSMKGLQLSERGDLVSTEVSALVANLPKHIADREVELIARRSAWRNIELHSIEIENDTGPGNVVMIDLRFEHCRHLIIEFGQRGIRAEQVASRALRQAKAFIKVDVPVGEHLADQLLLPAAIAAAFFGQSSQYVIAQPSLHTTTHIWLLEQLLDVNVRVEELCTAAKTFQVSVEPSE